MMPAGYKIAEQDQNYHLTLQVVEWVDLFTRKPYRDLLIQSLAFCQQNKSLDDATGNLIHDDQEQLDIAWNIANKPVMVDKDGDDAVLLEYRYDGTGNRVVKKTNEVTADVYIRDAQGNILAVYSVPDHHAEDTAIRLKNVYLYGSSRLGEWNADMAFTPPSQRYYHYKGSRRYELADHLGNVKSVITDRKIGMDPDSNTRINFFEADVIAAQDYYPGGMLMPGRSYSSTSYRFGMNGQEKDDEIAGNGSIYSALYWEYDSRSLRRWNLDPKPTVGISDYSCFGGNPIFNADPNGDYFFGLFGSTASERREQRAQTFATEHGGIVMHYKTSGKPFVVYDYNMVKTKAAEGSDAAMGMVYNDKYEDRFGDFSTFKNFANTLKGFDQATEGGSDGANRGDYDYSAAKNAGKVVLGYALGGWLGVGFAVNDINKDNNGKTPVGNLLNEVTGTDKGEVLVKTGELAANVWNIGMFYKMLPKAVANESVNIPLKIGEHVASGVETGVVGSELKKEIDKTSQPNGN